MKATIYTTIKIVIVFGALFLPITSFASMSSETFTIEADSINLADTNIMNSANFSIDGQLGEAILGGDITSANFEANTGFQNVTSPVTPPTPAPTAAVSGEEGFLPPLASFNVPLVLPPNREGILNQDLSGGKTLILQIPVGSVSSLTIFSVKEERLSRTDVPLRSIGADLVGDTIFRITAVDDGARPVTIFSNDLTVSLNIPDLPDDTKNLGVYYLDEDARRWVLVSGASFGDDNVIFRISHPLLFAAFQVPGVPETMEISFEGVDTNADGKIDILDFNTVMVQWGEADPDAIADFDNNGVVDIFDFNLLMVYWTT